MPDAVYQRVLLKLSGESLAGEHAQGLDFDRIRILARQLVELRDLGTEMALVIGGGNILRGREAKKVGVASVAADHVGMQATVLNACALAAVLSAEGVSARVLTATPMPAFAETWSVGRARRALANGEFVIAAGGIGQPYFSTDTTAALRAIELEADILLKATQVDGIYSADPRHDPDAQRLPRLSYDEVISRNLKIMDGTAFALCRDHSLPMRVFNFSEAGALRRLLQGDDLGSLVTQEDSDD
jgi:uridylate kinase